MAKKATNKRPARKAARPAAARARHVESITDPTHPRTWGGDIGAGDHVESVTDPTDPRSWGGNRDLVEHVIDPEDPRSWGGNR